MGNIHVLSKHISDKIAAGEVVERPASVIKELLENAVDAGATNICVEIKNGGITYMRVTDNGVGMTREDVELCVLRHATSKVATEEDLTRISTLGFRGEALSSIAAVSKLEIYTRAKGTESGTHLVAHNGEITDVTEAGCPEGTTVVVRELFCTVPARMKFLKKDFTEAGYIEDIVARLALSRPEISVKFIQNGKEVIFTPGDCQLASAIYAVYGKDIKNAMIAADFSYQGIRVHGMCGKASAARSNRNMENFFVNGRYIKSPLLARAAEEAYKNELMTGKFPACVLSVTLPPEHVDINIHPTKLEAKFADEKSVYHCMYWAVKNALYASQYVPQVSEHAAIHAKFVRPETGKQLFVRQDASPTGAAPKQPEPAAHAPKAAASGSVVGAADKKAPSAPTSFTLRETEPVERSQDIKPIAQIKSYIPEKDVKPEIVIHKQTPPAEQAAEKPVSAFPAEPVAEQSEPKTEPVLAEPKGEPSAYRIVGQVFATYIIVEKDGKMLMVDQHAAHERLRYEKLLSQYQNRRVTTQMLLCPEVVDVSALEFACFIEHREEIAKLGFEVEEFGERRIIVRGTPAEAGACDAKSTVLDMLDMLSDGRKRIDDALVSKMLYRIACRGAVKANAQLSSAEMKTLLDEIFALSGINTCPHGRPITVEFTKTFLEKQFKRIV